MILKELRIFFLFAIIIYPNNPYSFPKEFGIMYLSFYNVEVKTSFSKYKRRVSYTCRPFFLTSNFLFFYKDINELLYRMIGR